MLVTELQIYPIKSTRGVPLDQVDVQPWGLAGDRRWGVIDQAGNKVVSWRHHRLLQLLATPVAGGLQLSAPGRQPLLVGYPDRANRIPVGHTRLDSAVPAGPPAARWLSEWLDHPVQLVWLDDPQLRPMSAAHGGLPGEHVSLADAAPVLLTSRASLAQLDCWLAERAQQEGEPAAAPLAMARFRPNIVVDGELPFAEDGWAGVRIGTVPFRQSRPCDRCVVTMIDPEDLSRGREPIRTLARHRGWDGKTWFGIRLVPLSPGSVGVGDRVVPDSGVR
jgi:hypothetical protein